ncbi:hypothetical protein [Streptomyces fungicidicus]|uniref:hypothetical protein n=1 Tax=Streptomyces fungicidicus TaxID=68203 RepID=UPI003D757A6C
MQDELCLADKNRNLESFTYGFMNTLLNKFFREEDGYIVVPQSKETEGEVDFLLKKDGKVVAIVESKAYRGNYSLTHLYAQAIQYAETNHHSKDVFIIVNKGRFISFGQYTRYFHSSNNLGSKNFFFDGYIGYEMDKDLKIYPIPQRNTFHPQHKMYKLGRSNEHNLAIYRCLQHIRSFNGKPNNARLYFGPDYKVDWEGHISKNKSSLPPRDTVKLERTFYVDSDGKTYIV